MPIGRIRAMTRLLKMGENSAKAEAALKEIIEINGASHVRKTVQPQRNARKSLPDFFR